jgi:hypothetical protein
MFERAADRIEDFLAKSRPSLQFLQTPMPGAIANVGGKHVSAEAAEPLAVDDIETAPNLDRGGQNEAEHGGQRIRTPCRNLVESDSRVAVLLDAVSVHMNLMVLCKSSC